MQGAGRTHACNIIHFCSIHHHSLHSMNIGSQSMESLPGKSSPLQTSYVVSKWPSTRAHRNRRPFLCAFAFNMQASCMFVSSGKQCNLLHNCYLQLLRNCYTIHPICTIYNSSGGTSEWIEMCKQTVSWLLACDSTWVQRDHYSFLQSLLQGSTSP